LDGGGLNCTPAIQFGHERICSPILWYLSILKQCDVWLEMNGKVANHETIVPLFCWGRVEMTQNEFIYKSEIGMREKMGPHSYMKRIWTLFFDVKHLSHPK
jgi:hypothetical protein